MTFQQRLVAASVAAASLFGFAGCLEFTVQRRDDGILHLKCKDAKLQRCLDEAENLCGDSRYAVIRAFDDRDSKGRYLGLPALVTRDSEAFVVCGQEHAWGPLLQELRADPLGEYTPFEPVSRSAEPSVAPAPSRVCTPGASLACEGPEGCKGGHVCLPDGSAFGPCDCGPVR